MVRDDPLRGSPHHEGTNPQTAAIFEVDPHGEEARSAVSNHEGPSSVTNPSSSPAAERTHKLIAQRLHEIGQHRALAGLHEGFHRHAGDQLDLAEAGDLV